LTELKAYEYKIKPDSDYVEKLMREKRQQHNLGLLHYI